MFKQFDVVHLITTDRIKYLSGPPGQAASPHGNWSIIGFVELEAILAKDKTIVKVPLSDIKKVASYSIDSLLKKVFEAGGSSHRKNDNGKSENKKI